MQETCWPKIGLAAFVGLLLLWGRPSHAAVLDTGIHGMAWGGHISGYPRLEKLREAGDVSYYVDRRTVYQTAGQPVSGVIYGFYRERLFATYIKLRSPNQAYYLQKHFSGEYGPAKITTAGPQTIYRWEDKDLKIKLKVNDAGEDIKLGIYFQPLSTEFNQTLVEEGPPDAPAPLRPEEQGVESAPLF